MTRTELEEVITNGTAYIGEMGYQTAVSENKGNITQAEIYRGKADDMYIIRQSLQTYDFDLDTNSLTETELEELVEVAISMYQYSLPITDI